jgi:WhiB family redox-sensing transcriptional regulator
MTDGVRGERCGVVTMYALAAVPSGTEFRCLTDPDLFFAESPADITRAKELCRGCPVADACLAGALNRGEPWGVWGGELVLQGVVVASKRGRGRPRGSSGSKSRHTQRATAPDRELDVRSVTPAPRHLRHTAPASS